MKYFDFEHITFAHPLFFLLYLLLPVMIYWQWFRKKPSVDVFKMSSLDDIKKLPGSWKEGYIRILPVLKLLGISFFIFALARPQNIRVNEHVDSEGVDIILSMDISGSMLAEDLAPNRLDAAKKVAEEFINSRYTDRIGLVIFSGESFTQCPLTNDQNILTEQLYGINAGLLKDGTAIGMGLATSVDRLRHTKAKSKIIILLTDGVNNSGLVDPITALELAKAFQIRVYTIGVGTQGMAPAPVADPFGNVVMQQTEVQIDEDLLKKISSETGGQYYRATDNNSLRQIYKDIDKLEKTKVEITSFRRYSELFLPYALAGLFLMLLEFVLRNTLFRTLS